VQVSLQPGDPLLCRRHTDTQLEEPPGLGVAHRFVSSPASWWSATTSTSSHNFFTRVIREHGAPAERSSYYAWKAGPGDVVELRRSGSAGLEGPPARGDPLENAHLRSEQAQDLPLGDQLRGRPWRPEGVRARTAGCPVPSLAGRRRRLLSETGSVRFGSPAGQLSSRARDQVPSPNRPRHSTTKPLQRDARLVSSGRRS
jgi:hypothetical protein